jgi:hypothetical protein
MEIKMTYYRALLFACAAVIGTTSAYADDGKMDTSIRDDFFASPPVPPAPLFEGRASVSEPPPYAYEDGSTSERVPADIRERDIATEGNGNK